MGLGTDMNGLAPLSWVSLDAWSRHMEMKLEPREIEGLFWIDATYRNPGEAK